jgi:hypothetical protein
MTQIQASPPLPELASAARVLAGFGHGERLEAVLMPRLEGLVEAIPRLRTWRGFSSGAWVIGARTAADEQRLTRADYSRIDFELRIDTESGRADLTCRSTIRSRDRRTEQVSLELDAAGVERASAWFETMLLAFGQQYFEPV